MSDLPTPAEVLLDPISLTVLAMYAALMVWEEAAPARPLPRVRGWRVRGLLSFAVYFYLSTYLPLLWDASLAPYQLFDLSGLGIAGATVAGVLVFELGAWAYHRLIHEHDLLFRTIHQMHHSAERMDTTGTFYFSPLDMIGWTALGSLCLVFIVGVPPQAATAILLFTTWLAIFQHTNVRTPRWLGYLVQRPEQHAVHHARGIHAGNYSDLPVFDMLFGTFNNPLTYEHETGFYQGASARVGDMLMMRDVTVAPVHNERSDARATTPHGSTSTPACALRLDDREIPAVSHHTAA